jgi:hypothetical protein
MSPRRLTILAVGDGDLSCSLAILRAYGNPPASNDADNNHIILQHLVATTLISCQEELFDTYEPSQRILVELLQESSSSWLSLQQNDSSATCRVQVLYGIDATRLHTYPSLSTRKFDVILFHHPHLGYKKKSSNQRNDDNIECTRNDSTSPPQTVDEEDDDDDQHAMQHSCLLAHYFDSAQQLLARNGSIHVCLCSGAVSRWKLDDIVQRLNLKYVFNSPRPASSPLLDFFLLGDSDQSTTTGVVGLDQQAPKHRLGGSRKGHWLGKYGYRHQPTFPQVNRFKTNVSNSHHYFLQPRDRRLLGGNDDNDNCKSSSNDDCGHPCPICNQTFGDLAALQAHRLAPALPSNPI